MKTKTFAFILAVLLPVTAHAQDATYARVAETIEQKVVILNVDCSDADIRKVLLQIADLAEVNVHIPPELKGSTTLRLHGVTWQQALDVLCVPFGYRHQADGNIVKLVEVHPGLKPWSPPKELLELVPPPKEVYVSMWMSALAAIVSIASLVIAVKRRKG